MATAISGFEFPEQFSLGNIHYLPHFTVSGASTSAWKSGMGMNVYALLGFALGARAVPSGHAVLAICSARALVARRRMVGATPSDVGKHVRSVRAHSGIH